jgi:glycogen(starch) synthase
VLNVHEHMKRAGLQSNVLNIDPRAPANSAYIKISGAADFLCQLFRHVSDDWTLSVHTNGHNPKSWLIALLCGIAAQWGPPATLTLHSGGVPLYLGAGPEWRRLVARLTCVMYGQIVCVNAEIARALSTLGVPQTALEIAPAFVPFEKPSVDVPENIGRWMAVHSPRLSTAMFFRPEYGFDLLLEAMTELRRVHPNAGCVVMGDGEHRKDSMLLVQRAGLEDSMLLAGDLDHEQCLALMSRSDVFVRPTFMDGDSISVREALALGVPVVASNVGVRPEGTTLFEAGNKSELVERVEDALRGRHLLPLGEGRVRASGFDETSIDASPYRACASRDPHPRDSQLMGAASPSRRGRKHPCLKS